MRRAPGRDGRGARPGDRPAARTRHLAHRRRRPRTHPRLRRLRPSDRTKAERATADDPRHGPGEAGVVLDTDEYGERAGRHLPGAPDSSRRTTPSLKSDRPGAHRVRTTARPGLRRGTGTAIGPRIDDGSGRAEKHRVQIFVNGWNTGPYVSDVGPQQEFVILSGFLVQSPSGG